MRNFLWELVADRVEDRGAGVVQRILGTGSSGGLAGSPNASGVTDSQGEKVAYRRRINIRVKIAALSPRCQISYASVWNCAAD